MLARTQAYLRPFFQVALLQRPPQDIPQSIPLFRFTLILYSLLGIFNTSFNHSFSHSVSIVLVDVFMLIFMLYLWLKMFGWQNRWMQTVTALSGAGCIIGFFAIPITLLSVQEWQGNAVVLMIFFQVFLFVWNICIFAYVFKHAFSTNIVVASAMAFFYYLFFLSVVSLFIFRVQAL